ncbi:FAD-dependent oxidoreductase [Duganella sp. FT135W]|uniref:FAD-dependent oxidoreductase n=1 Tax=Duganella flavida TaxID=2692175 RepID=A0A6L8KA57_9BURK|nr:FAD-binding oxidoreductase [Duganella flavida]MYM24246.1 FAD-dependent oxidoreductase [Duganella flavida]
MGQNHRDEKLRANSYYEATVTREQASPPLRVAVRADVCVIGAGFAGLSAAIELAERGYSVTVLEAQTVGWGASGRNGGQAIVGYASDDAIEGQFPRDEARAVWHMSVEAMELLRQRIAKYAIDCDYTPGYMSVAITHKKAQELDRWVGHLQHTYDYDMQSIPAPQMKDWIASERFVGGAFDPKSGHLHPLKYCLGLAAAARALGVKIYENSAVTRVERGSPAVVHTQDGRVSCDFVVMAGNVYLNEYGESVARELDKNIMPVGTYIIATEPMDPARAAALIAQRSAACDTNFVLDYFRPTADHRMLFGGRVSYSTVTPMNLAASMRKRMLAVFPQLADLEVTHAWGGFVDITMNRAPDFGRLGGNIYYLQGFSGHGVALTGLAGKLVAEAIVGQAERFDLIGRISHRAFPGGSLLRMPALVTGMMYYHLRDVLEI